MFAPEENQSMYQKSCFYNGSYPMKSQSQFALVWSGKVSPS